MFIEGINDELSNNAAETTSGSSGVDLGSMGFKIQRGQGILPDEDEEGA